MELTGVGGKGNEEGGGTAFEEGERGEGEGRRAELMFLAPFVVVFFPPAAFLLSPVQILLLSEVAKSVVDAKSE